MTTQKKLTSQFFNGLAWNGIALSIQKLSSLIFSISLYKLLPVEQFSAWAITNSIVFLLLLWLDCGLRKSIPRYAPIFIKNSKLHKKFIFYVIIFQLLLLSFIGAPTLFFTLSKILKPSHLSLLLVPCGILFIIEGIASVLRLMYHAHSLQKFFNTTYTVKTLLEMVLNYILLIAIAPTESILLSIIINRIIGTTILIIVSLYNISYLYISSQDRLEPIDAFRTTKQFICHSFFMWASTFIKSFSERNFLLPFLTFLIGPAIANLFKVTHDSALFFQRIVLKTIGVTDTTLLSHSEESKNVNLKSIFKILFKTIQILCLPLSAAALAIFMYKSNYSLSATQLIIFMIFVVSYLLEIILSPYERILETKRRYKTLWANYAPYCIIFVLATIFMALGEISLLAFLVIIQISRLISSLCNMKSAKLILNKLY